MITKQTAHTQSRMKMLLAALLLVLTMNLAPQVVSEITGLDLAPSVHACTNQGSGGDC